MAVDPTIVAALAALFGSLIGGGMSLLGSKLSSDREFKQKKEDILRDSAYKRINELYKPLLITISPSPPYDEYYLENEDYSRIIDLIDKNEKYASPDLLRIFWNIRSSYYNDQMGVPSDLDWELLHQVTEEHAQLKELLGFGKIINNKSKFKLLITAASDFAGGIFQEIKPKRIKRKIKSLYKKYLTK